MVAVAPLSRNQRVGGRRSRRSTRATVAVARTGPGPWRDRPPTMTTTGHADDHGGALRSHRPAAGVGGDDVDADVEARLASTTRKPAVSSRSPASASPSATTSHLDHHRALRDDQGITSPRWPVPGRGTARPPDLGTVSWLTSSHPPRTRASPARSRPRAADRPVKSGILIGHGPLLTTTSTAVSGAARCRARGRWCHAALGDPLVEALDRLAVLQLFSSSACWASSSDWPARRAPGGAPGRVR